MSPPPVTDDKPYTMREALREASEMLASQFGQADQRAAVALANILYGAHEKEMFMKQRAKPDERAFA